jgi:hypothetical protein
MLKRFASSFQYSSLHSTPLTRLKPLQRFLFQFFPEFDDLFTQVSCVLTKKPATLRAQIFLGGAILGKSGGKQVLHLSSAWGGLETRNPLFEKILSYVFPTSPKLDLALQNACP